MGKITIGYIENRVQQLLGTISMRYRNKWVYRKLSKSMTVNGGYWMHDN